MKINKILVVATLLINFVSNAQIEQGNWMMGGSGSFGNYKIRNGDDSFNSTQIGINPNIGYFIIDKSSYLLKDYYLFPIDADEIQVV